MKRQTFFVEVVFCRLKSVYGRFGLPALFGFLPIKKGRLEKCPKITLFRCDFYINIYAISQNTKKVPLGAVHSVKQAKQIYQAWEELLSRQRKNADKLENFKNEILPLIFAQIVTKRNQLTYKQVKKNLS